MMRSLLLAIVLCLSNSAFAHELSMAEMEVREASPGEFLWQWTASGARPAGSGLTPLRPGSCQAGA